MVVLNFWVTEISGFVVKDSLSAACLRDFVPHFIDTSMPQKTM